MRMIQTWDGIIAGEQINPPEYRMVEDDPRDEYNPYLDESYGTAGLQITAASYQKTAQEIAWDVEEMEAKAERAAAHDRAVQLAIESNERFARSCRRERRRTK